MAAALGGSACVSLGCCVADKRRSAAEMDDEDEEAADEDADSAS